MTSKLVGKPTAKPMTNPYRKRMGKAEFRSVVISVIVNVIVVSMHNVINKAVNAVQYFRSTFKTCPPQPES
jgi:hypothetical protein